MPWWTSFLVRTYAIAGLLANGGPLADLLDASGWWTARLNLLNSSGAVAIGIVYSYLPLMILPLYVALERVDDTLRQAASDLGAPPTRVFRRVVLPLSMPGIVAGCLLVGIPATGEYVIPRSWAAARRSCSATSSPISSSRSATSRSARRWLSR